MRAISVFLAVTAVLVASGCGDDDSASSGAGGSAGSAAGSVGTGGTGGFSGEGGAGSGGFGGAPSDAGTAGEGGTDGTAGNAGTAQDGGSSGGQPHGRIVAGERFTCVILEDDSVTCWGNLQKEPATEIGSSEKPRFKKITAGDSQFACGIKLTGETECWIDIPSLDEDPPDTAFVEIDCSNTWCCGIGTDGGIECWGSEAPSDIPEGSFEQISCGSGACALDVDGALTCWGRDWTGEYEPPDGTFMSISLRRIARCAIRADGSIVCWPPNPGTIEIYDPPSGNSFRQVVVGSGSYACALDNAGEATCWGVDNHSVGPPLPGPFVEISAGEDFGCGIRENGEIACWGSGSEVQVPEGITAKTGP